MLLKAIKNNLIKLIVVFLVATIAFFIPVQNVMAVDAPNNAKELTEMIEQEKADKGITTSSSEIVDPDTYNPNTAIDPVVKNITQSVVNVLFVIAVVAAVIVIMIIGVITIVGSSQEKAEYKKRLFPVLFGIIFIALLSKIITMLINTGKSL